MGEKKQVVCRYPHSRKYLHPQSDIKKKHEMRWKDLAHSDLDESGFSSDPYLDGSDGISINVVEMCLLDSLFRFYGVDLHTSDHAR